MQKENQGISAGLLVYCREKQNCLICSTMLKAIRISNRATVYCRVCQKVKNINNFFEHSCYLHGRVHELNNVLIQEKEHEF